MIGFFKMLIEKSPTVDLLNRRRIFETRDIAKRLVFISADNIFVTNYPLKPVKAFNSTLLIEGDKVIVFTRLIFDYYKYVSSIARLEFELDDLLTGGISYGRDIKGEISIFPDRLEDIWGAEDPRVLRIDGDYVLAYTGRTKWYYKEDNDDSDYVKTTTVLAKSKDTVKWEKSGAITFENHFREKLETIKNCVPVKGDKGNYALCRIHTKAKQFFTVIAKINHFMEEDEKFKDIVGRDLKIGIENADFEIKNGWGTPPIKISNREYVAILHGVDKELYTYRAFAVMLEEKDGLEVTSVTPYYIMKPSTVEERYGDRPNVIFPCGLQRVDDDLIVSYGAADSFIGFASIKLDQILEILDKNRL